MLPMDRHRYWPLWAPSCLLTPAHVAAALVESPELRPLDPVLGAWSTSCIQWWIQKGIQGL